MIRSVLAVQLQQGVQVSRYAAERPIQEPGLIEQWGSGVRRMFREALEQDLPDPEILETGMRVRFTIYLAQGLIAYTLPDKPTSHLQKYRLYKGILG
jgi:ATP-dependent DNA helicase RecG